MMSRRNTFPSLSSSRQMMMAWKVSGLSHRPAIMASRLASMRLAMAISPWRESNSIDPIVRRYMRTGSSLRSGGSLASDLAGTFCWTSTSSPLPLSASSSDTSRCSSPSSLASLVSTTLTTHPAEHGEDILDLLGIDLLRGQDRVDLVMCDVATLLGGADELYGRIGEAGQRAVRRGLAILLLQRLFLVLLGERLDLAYHVSL